MGIEKGVQETNYQVELRLIITQRSVHTYFIPPPKPNHKPLQLQFPDIKMKQPLRHKTTRTRPTDKVRVLIFAHKNRVRSIFLEFL